MSPKHLTRGSLRGKTIDSHSHVGVALKMYANVEYPYAETAEGIYYKQLAGGVDVNVAFPFTFDLYCDWKALLAGKVVPGDDSVSNTPYGIENRVLMREIFDFRPELSERFLPFVSVDPARDIRGQLAELESLEGKYPIYGIKINPVACQSKVASLLDEGSVFLDFAAARDIPFIFHATTVDNDIYSQASDIFEIAESRPDLRFCLAHALIFNKEALERAAEMDNVWVDTAALKIQVDLLNLLVDDGVISTDSLIGADFSDYREVMRFICEKYPDTIIWGSDSPAYSFHCVRAQGDGNIQDYSLKGCYDDEVVALNSLNRDFRVRVSNANTLDFVFGRE